VSAVPAQHRRGDACVALFRRARRRAGLGLVELMVALAIAASLLTATAVALDASIKAYQINLQQAALLQQARSAMNRILTTVRKTKLHAPDTAALRTSFAGNTTVTDIGLQMLDDNNTLIIFRYDAPNQTVNLIAGGVTHPLIRGVEDFQVTMEPMRSAASAKVNGPFDLLKRAAVLITVKTTNQNSLGDEAPGKVHITLSASTMPRRNSW
jgi:prepilin-type N-terminal cleavage/methylation domain-containing protein